MKNKGITYGSVDSAYEILYLTEGKDIRSNKNFPLARSINGTAKRPPKPGDLVIYHPTKDDPKWRYGHVAAVIATNLEEGTVSLAEENYTNKPWEDPEAYARKIRLFEIGGATLYWMFLAPKVKIRVVLRYLDGYIHCQINSYYADLDVFQQLTVILKLAY